MSETKRRREENGCDTKIVDHFDPSSPVTRQEILAMIAQYLREEGYVSSTMVLQDEANMKADERKDMLLLLKRLHQAILRGEWGEVDKLYFEVEKLGEKQRLKDACKYLNYEIYKQQYLELIHRQEQNKAFAFLKKRLKPFQQLKGKMREFQDLCFLLTCNQVNEAQSFKDWVGIESSRERLAEWCRQFISTNKLHLSRPTGGPPEPPPGRLIHMLRQAVAYQIESSSGTGSGSKAANGEEAKEEGIPAAGTATRTRTTIRDSHTSTMAKTTAKTTTSKANNAGIKGKQTRTSRLSLLSDYSCCRVAPHKRHRKYTGHTLDVKTLSFVGTSGQFLATGSSDMSIRIWDTESGECKSVLGGHVSKIWAISSDDSGAKLLSGSANGTVKIWNAKDGKCFDSHNFHRRAVYSVDLKRSGSHYASGGFDAKVRIVDVSSSKVVSELSRHTGLVSSVVFNKRGGLVVSGSRDCSICLWDSTSGSCIRSINKNLGEITSVDISQNELYILSSSKDNCVRLWDIRMGKCVKKYTGSQNTWKNFVKSCFGPEESVIVSGSEDGNVLLWDRHTADLLHKINAHHDIVYTVKWNPACELLASCAHDGSVRTWC